MQQQDAPVGGAIDLHVSSEGRAMLFLHICLDPLPWLQSDPA